MWERPSTGGLLIESARRLGAQYQESCAAPSECAWGADQRTTLCVVLVEPSLLCKLCTAQPEL